MASVWVLVTILLNLKFYYISKHPPHTRINSDSAPQGRMAAPCHPTPACSLLPRAGWLLPAIQRPLAHCSQGQDSCSLPSHAYLLTAPQGRMAAPCHPTPTCSLLPRAGWLLSGIPPLLAHCSPRQDGCSLASHARLLTAPRITCPFMAHKIPP
jgi:hypothetical protein